VEEALKLYLDEGFREVVKKLLEGEKRDRTVIEHIWWINKTAKC